ncbi:MAG: hypothetical protein JSR33_09965 [Proteobacteria bacterium]|nr:hypothetical protein [Pseudomonadota bacterium]
MSKIRTVKPELFRHEELFEAEKKWFSTAFNFYWSFTTADAQGRFH